jgi:rSAM/selenodomain-associated transferase 1
MSQRTLLVFLKRPDPGKVKTRLIPPLSAEDASRLYRVIAEEEVRRTAPRSGEYRRLFCYTPTDALESMQAWFPGEEWLAQSEGDLGARMAHAFGEAFARGAARVAIVGSDVPWISRTHVMEAFDALNDHDLVLGPARDGGYYLLAMSRTQPELFEGVAWSTPTVLADTFQRASGLGLKGRVLETLSDIDSVKDVRDAWYRLRPLLPDDLARAVEEALRAS